MSYASRIDSEVSVADRDALRDWVVNTAIDTDPTLRFEPDWQDPEDENAPAENVVLGDIGVWILDREEDLLQLVAQCVLVTVPGLSPNTIDATVRKN